MHLQKFETLPDSRSLEVMVDMMRYENASQSSKIHALEEQVNRLKKELRESQEALDDVQVMLDLASAELLIHKNGD